MNIITMFDVLSLVAGEGITNNILASWKRWLELINHNSNDFTIMSTCIRTITIGAT